MAVIIAFLVAAFFILIGTFIAERMKTRRISLRERLENRTVAGSGILREKENDSFAKKVEDKLSRSKTGMTVTAYFGIMLLSAILIFLAVYFLTDSLSVGLLSSIAGFYIPNYILNVLIRKRKKEFDSQFIKALKVLSASMRAQSSLPQAVEDVTVSESLPEAIREEFRQVLTDYGYHSDMPKAFEDMYVRTKNEDVRGLSIAVRISDEKGSDLSMVFENFAEAISMRQEMEAEGRALLSATRTNTLIVSIVPFVFGAAMKVLDPHYFDAAYNWLGGIGRLIIVLCYGVVVFGYLYLTRKCDIKL